MLAGIFTAVAAATLLTDAAPVPGELVYIVTGAVIGQAVAVPDLTLLAEAGAVLLIFLVTAHMQVDAVTDVLPAAAWAVSAQAVLLVAATTAAILAGFGAVDALLVGLAASMSSSMLSVDMIGNQVDRRLLHGRLTEAVTIGQDVAAVLVVAALPFWPLPVAALAAAAAGGAVLLAIRAQAPMRRVLAWLDRDEAATVMLGLTVLWAVEAAMGGHAYGPVLGAVVAGFLLAGHPENLTLLETLSPIRDFFAALFFVVLGVLVAAPTMPALGLAAALTVVVAVVRPVLTAVVLRLRGVDLHAAVITALQLDQVSEIVLLLALLLSAAGIVSPAIFQAVVIAAAATFLLSDLTTRHAHRLYPLLYAYIGRDRAPVDRTGHTVLAGYGGWGRAAAAVLDDPVVIDNDPDKVTRARQDGYTAILGDIHDHTAWDRAAVDRADAVVLTVPADRIATRLAGMQAAGDATFTLVAITDTAETADAVRAQGAAYASDDASLASTAFRDVLDDALDDTLTAASDAGDTATAS